MPTATVRFVTILLLAAATNGSAADRLGADPPGGDAAVEKRVVLSATGDVPYAPEEDLLLPRQIAELPKGRC
ncbi:MAG: hypothetical protein WD066_18565 [Planctomycetaceae bacterium]